VLASFGDYNLRAPRTSSSWRSNAGNNNTRDDLKVFILCVDG
jgi:hypothetical protein